jgi:phosphoribosylanthranilate isomerase
MRIKFCGMTRASDALLAAELGAWAVGFIFYEKSRRFILPVQAVEIVSVLPKDILKVGVFVNQNNDVLKIAQTVKLDMIQLHGNETPEDCRRFLEESGVPVIKAFRPSCVEDLDLIETYRECIDYALIDAHVAGEYGGTGHTSDWTLAAKVREMGFSLILSGGLNHENVAAAYEAVKPFAVDLSGGVEIAPGIKDEAKLRSVAVACRHGR